MFSMTSPTEILISSKNLDPVPYLGSVSIGLHIFSHITEVDKSETTKYSELGLKQTDSSFSSTHGFSRTKTSYQTKNISSDIEIFFLSSKVNIHIFPHLKAVIQ